MPVAVNFQNEKEPALHEDAVDWNYLQSANISVIALLDSDDNIVAELIPENVNQITPLTDEEFEEAVEILR